ncbi:MAG: ABC transporter permease [Mycobacteriales bacterium]
MAFRRYIAKKALWYLLALIVALVLNFFLPRLVPGNPVDSIIAQASRSGAEGDQLRGIHDHYIKEFGLNKSMIEQFLTYLNNLIHGNLGLSFANYPGTVSSQIKQALPWTLGLQIPAILIGWLVGNAVGAIAAYKGGWFDRSAFLGSLFLSAMPYYCLAILLVYLLAVQNSILPQPILPASGGYLPGTSPSWSGAFIADVLRHYWMPFLSLVIVFIGGQAVGMRSMAIYELGTDYVTYGRGLGLRDRTLMRYIFRNGMLPQVTGLALSIGTLVGGALITEIVFSYPGVGTLLFNAISQNDYPVLQAITLIITVAVLVANFLVDLAYGIIDPRIRAAQAGER